MKTKILIAIAGILIAAAQVFAIDVVELKKEGLNKVVVKVRFQNGSISDPAGKEGITYLTSQLLMEIGSENFTKEAIDAMNYKMGVASKVLTDKEVTTFTFQVHKDFVDEYYSVIKEKFLVPAFTEEAFNRVKSNQQNYVDQLVRASSDEEYSKKALEDMLFRGTRYQHMTAGTSEGVESITLDDVKAHFSNVFAQDNLTIGLAGPYSATFKDQMLTDMQALPESSAAISETESISMPEGIHVEIVSKTNALGSAIFTGYPLELTRASDDFAALMVANSWLGEHRKSYSRLYQKIREERSMNYGDYTYIEWYQDGGRNQLPLTGTPRQSNYFSIWIRPVQIQQSLVQQYPELNGINIGHAHYALRMAIKEMDLMIENGMSKEDFELTRDFLRSYIKLYVQTPEKELGFLMDSRFYGRTNWIQEADQLLAKLTVEDVNAVVKKYFQTKNMNVVIITDDSEAKALAESLKNNTTSPMSYSNILKEVLTEEIFEEDKVVETYPLNVKQVKIVNSEDTF